jgi:hypothetical protein
MPLDVLNTILPPSAAECEDSSLVHAFQPPASSRARLSGSSLIHPFHFSLLSRCQAPAPTIIHPMRSFEAAAACQCKPGLGCAESLDEPHIDRREGIYPSGDRG